MKSSIETYVNQLYNLNLPEKQRLFFERFIAHSEHFTEIAKNILLDRYCKINNPQPKECYRNSLLLACTCDEIYYVEGYIYSAQIGFPIEHAWNVNSKNEIIDTTAHRVGFNSDEYLGIVIPDNILREYLETDQQLTALQYYLTKK